MKSTRVRRKIRLSPASYEEGHAFLITVNTARRHPWFKSYPALADRTIGLILELASTRKAAVYAWCVMPDHVHLLIQDDNIIDFIRLFKGKLTPLARRIENERPFWQRSFYDHALWQNPVRAFTQCST
jgi:REP element-mobilizing transposase RayT